jgi:antitoxin HigA-1
MPRRLPPVHPGEILQEEFLKPLGLSQYRVAKSIGVPPRRINEIVHGKRAVTADTALRLARYFGTTPEFWLNLQVHHDLERTRGRVGASIVAEVTPLCRRAAPRTSARTRKSGGTER